MNKGTRAKHKVKISPESVLNLRLSVLESKVDRMLSILAPEPDEVSLDKQLESAILAHLRGDQGPKLDVDSGLDLLGEYSDFEWDEE
jgi:hypothetical protein